jgi:hypothetical protein
MEEIELHCSDEHWTQRKDGSEPILPPNVAFSLDPILS